MMRISDSDWNDRLMCQSSLDRIAMQIVASGLFIQIANAFQSQIGRGFGCFGLVVVVLCRIISV